MNWYDDPKILYENWSNIFPLNILTNPINKIINSIIRAIILIVIIFIIITGNISLRLILISTMLIIIISMVGYHKYEHYDVNIPTNAKLTKKMSTGSKIIKKRLEQNTISKDNYCFDAKKRKMPIGLKKNMSAYFLDNFSRSQLQSKLHSDWKKNSHNDQIVNMGNHIIGEKDVSQFYKTPQRGYFSKY